MWNTNKQYEFNEAFQLKIISLMLRDPKFLLNYADVLHSSYFKSQYLVNISRKVLEYFQQYKDTPTLDIFAEIMTQYLRSNNLKDQFDLYINLIHDLYSLDLRDKDYIIDQIVDFGRKRSVETSILKGIELLSEGKFDDFKGSLDKAFLVGMGMDDLGYSYVDNFETRIKSRKESFTRGIGTGFEDIDRYLKNKGLNAGEVGTILAPTGGGKSLMLCNMAVNAMLKGHKVLYITLEMQPDSLGNRIDAITTGINVKDLLKDTNESALLEKKELFKKLGFDIEEKFFPGGTCNINMILAYVEKLKVARNFEPDIIFIDYGEEMKPTIDHRDTRHNHTQIYKDIVYGAQILQLPIWTASQTNNTGLSAYRTGETVDLDSMGESKAKSHRLSVVLSLVSETADDAEIGISRVFIAKNRDGIKHKTIKLEVDYNNLTMKSAGLLKTKEEAKEVQQVKDYFDDDDDEGIIEETNETPKEEVNDKE